MSRARCPTAGRGRSDTGVTLIEVMVGMVIFSVLGSLLAGFVISTLRTSSGTSSRISNVDELRVAMDDITKGLRTAIRPEQINVACATACDAAFLAASSSAVTFYANHGVTGKAQLTTYRVEENLPVKPGTGRFVEERFAEAAPGGSPSTTCATGCTKRTLATGLTWPVVGADPVFAFADDHCAAFTTTLARADIACVVVDLPVVGARDNPGTSATATVFLPNSVMGH